MAWHAFCQRPQESDDIIWQRAQCHMTHMSHDPLKRSLIWQLCGTKEEIESALVD